MKTTAAVSFAGLALSVILGVFIGLSGYTFRYAEGTSYLSNDPKACVNCHVMRDQYDGWQKGSHHATATCNDCHVPRDAIGKYATKASHGWRHSKGFTLQNFHEPIRITRESLEVVQANCVACHSDFVSDVAVSRGSQHGMVIGDLNCVRCHSHVGHGPIR